MPAIATDKFLATLAKSKLLSDGQVDELRRDADQSGGDATALARQLVTRKLITRWQARQLLAGHGQFYLGKYKLVERIGMGGMGTVYKAEHTVMNRTVALKVISKEILQRPNAVARFHREVQASARLNHPNIVTAFDADCVGDTHFLVMEYVKGKDLKGWLADMKTMPIEPACECIRQVALGLEHAHRHGMIHRDVKPSNVLVASGPLMKILDMGLARLTTDDDESMITQQGQIMGSPDYIAPEQAAKPTGADTRADIFSLGVMMFQMLTGKLPFDGNTVVAKLLARTKSDAPRLRELRSDAPTELEAVLAKMLARDPDERYQTAAEVAAAVEPFSSQRPGESAINVLASPPAPASSSSSVGSDSAVGSSISGNSSVGADAALNDFLQNLATESATDTPASGISTVDEAHETTAPVPSQPPLRIRDSSGALPVAKPLDSKVSGSQVTAGASKAAVAPPATKRKNALPKGAIWWLAGAVAGVALLLGAVAIVFVLATWRGDDTISTDDAVVESDDASPDDSSGDDVAPQPPPAEPPAPNPQPKPPVNPKPPPPQPGPINPTPPKPGADPADPANPPPPTVPDPTDPANPPPPKPGNTLIVGGGEGQFIDLAQALAKAEAGDTIVIEHPGPLELEPVDLTGKTPLTIAGGNLDGVEYWPLIRQLPEANSHIRGPRPGLFFGDQLDLTFRNLHLAAGGFRRAKIDGMVSCGAGRVQIEHCTVTVANAADHLKPAGDPVALVNCSAAGAGSIEVVLRNCLARGERLQSCLRSDGVQHIDVSAEHLVWAGGRAPFLALNQVSQQAAARFDRCTIYNVTNFLLWQSSLPPSSEPFAAKVEMTKSIVVGADDNSETLIAWNPLDLSKSLTEAVAEKQIDYRGAGNVFYDFAGYFKRNGKPADVDDWCGLWQQDDATKARQANPAFNVHPVAYELQESHARDFLPHFERNTSRAEQLKDTDLGVDIALLPSSLVRSFLSARVNADTKAPPRGEPRVLIVHQSQGPHKTLEEAFAAVGDGDVIEIADDGVYTPKRNFNAAPGNGVLIAPPGQITIRAAAGAKPVLLLDDQQQQSRPPDSDLALIHCDYTALELEGLHFRMNTAPGTFRVATRCDNNPYLRVTNCSFVDTAQGDRGARGPDGTHILAHIIGQNNPSGVRWFENNFYSANHDDKAYFIGGEIHGGTQYLKADNCLFNGRCFYFKLGSHLGLRFNRNSFFAPVGYVNGGIQLTSNCDHNLIVCPADPLTLHSGTLDVAIARGEGNAMWLTTRLLTAADRSSGANAILPGPLVAAPPEPAGRPSVRDPYAGYRLKKNPLPPRFDTPGAQTELLPDLPRAPR